MTAPVVVAVMWVDLKMVFGDGQLSAEPVDGTRKAEFGNVTNCNYVHYDICKR